MWLWLAAKACSVQRSDWDLPKASSWHRHCAVRMWSFKGSSSLPTHLLILPLAYTDTFILTEYVKMQKPRHHSSLQAFSVPHFTCLIPFSGFFAWNGGTGQLLQNAAGNKPPLKMLNCLGTSAADLLSMPVFSLWTAHNLLKMSKIDKHQVQIVK